MTITDRTFVGMHPTAGGLYDGFRFERCFFDNCAVYPGGPERERTRLRNIVIVDCRVWACQVDWAIVEDVVVDGLKTGGGGGRTIGFSVSGAVLKHVVLRGNIGTVGFAAATRLWHRRVPSLFARLFQKDEVRRRAQELAIDGENKRLYEEVDWALDIREARFYSVAISGVPARLIRRDPETQAVVTRRNAQDGLGSAVERLPGLRDSLWPDVLQRFLQYDSAEEIVLVAPKRHPRFKEDLAGIRQLREAGVAEPD